MTDERILTKIRKVLELAKNNSSTEEAQSAMLKVQEMLVKHGLKIGDLDAEEYIGADQVEHVIIDETGCRVAWKEILSQIIAVNFRCEFLFARLRDSVTGKLVKRQLMLIGMATDVAVAKATYLAAVEVIDSGVARLIKERQSERMNWHTGNSPIANSVDSLKVRKSYIGGFLTGLRKRFLQQVEQNDWGLILAKPKQVLDFVAKLEYSEEEHHSEVNYHGDFRAYKLGFDKGLEFGSGSTRLQLEKDLLSKG